jgi:hypothetical protein
MNKVEGPHKTLSILSTSRSLFRMLFTLLLIGSLVACAVSPAKTVPSEAKNTVEFKNRMTAAANMYNSRNYPGAIREFDNIIRDENATANSRRLAHLGKALVYLGPDENWHSVDNAKLALISAGQVAPEGNEEFSVETDLLMDSVSAVIGTESKYSVLAAKSNGSGDEVLELKRELDTVKAERDELLTEQQVLNEAIEKLKALTLGS